MFENAVKKVQKSIFPIFFEKTISLNTKQIGVAGTGFFINDNGYFVTVAHIFDSADANARFLYIGLLPENIHRPEPLVIEEIAKRDVDDIFIGKLAITDNEYLHLSKEVSGIGKSICISGYPLADIKLNKHGGIDLSGVRRYFQPTFILDHGMAKNKNASGLERAHVGYLIRDVGLFGMSGGPVFDVQGTVIGMQASVTDPRKSSNGSGREIVVENALAIQSSKIIDVLDQYREKIINKGVSSTNL